MRKGIHMTKKLDMKILILLLLLMFSLAGCNVANGSEETSNVLTEPPEVESVEKPSSISEEAVVKVESEPESEAEFVFTKRLVYFFPNGKDFILIPDSWKDAYGVIEGSDSVLFLHNNTEDIYAPLMKVKMYKSEEAWLNAKEKGANEEDGVYRELGKSDSIIYGAKVFTTNYYQLGDNPNSDLAQAFDSVFADFYHCLNTFNLEAPDSEIRNKKKDLINGSAFTLKMAEKSEEEVDKEPIATMSILEQVENGGFIRKYGYINKYGEFVIPSIYDQAKPFKDGVAIVRKGNYYGLINKEGKTVLDIKYDYLRDYSEGYIVYSEYGTLKEGYMDLEGNIVIPAQYQKAYPFSEGKAVVMTTKGLYGYIDKEGKIFVRPRFKYAEPYFQNTAYADGGGKTTYLGADGLPIFDFIKPALYPETFKSTPLINGVMFKKYFPYDDSEWTEADYYDHMDTVEWLMINKDNKSVTDARFDQVNYAEDNPFFTVLKSGEWLIIDEEANTIGTSDYDMICPENNGFSIQQENQWGLLDKAFKVLIPPLYTTRIDFHNGIGTAELCGMNLFIDEHGQVFHYALDYEEMDRDNLIKIPFDMSDITGANALQLFNYKIEDFEKAFSGEYIIQKKGSEDSDTGLYFHKEGIGISFIGSIPGSIEMSSYDGIVIGDSLDKVLSTLEASPNAISKDELNYKISGHLLSFQSRDNQTVDNITLYCLEHSIRYFRDIESDEEISDLYDSSEMTVTITKDDQVIKSEEGDRPLEMLKWLDGRLILYLDVELLMTYIGGEYRLNEQTGTLRIDYLDSTYYYKNKFWQDKDGNYFEEGDGTLVLNDRCYLEARSIHDFFKYTVVWNQDHNQISLTYNPNKEMLYPITEIPPNKMLVYATASPGVFEEYREVFMVDSFIDIYRRESAVVPDTPHTGGHFRIKIIQKFIAEESADYKIETDDTWSEHYYKQGKTYKPFETIARLQAGENILIHNFDASFPKVLSIEKIAPQISEEALLYQLEDVLKSESKVVYVIDRVNGYGDTSSVEIAPSHEPIVLCLASLKQVNWLIENPENVNIQAIVYGREWYKTDRPTVTGDIDNIPIYYSDKMLAPRALILGNQPVPDDYAYNQSEIEKNMVELDLWIQKTFGKQAYSLTYIEKDEVVTTDQIILDETYYMYLDEITERIKKSQ